MKWWFLRGMFLKGYHKKHPEFPKTKEEVMELILDCFNSAAERDIYTGILEILGRKAFVKVLF